MFMRTNVKKMLLRELLARKTPNGYYLIPSFKKTLRLIDLKDIEVEEYNAEIVFLKTKSRNKAKQLIEYLIKRGLVAEI